MSNTHEHSPRITRKRARARASIVAAARDLVRQEGYENFTMDGLALAADVSKPSLYYYFASKEAVVAALAQRVAAECVDALLTALDSSESGPDAVHALVAAYVDYYLDAMNLFRIEFVFSQTVSAVELSDDVDAKMVELFDRISVRLGADAAAGRLHDGLDVRRTAVLIWTSAHGLMSTLSVLDHANSRLAHGVDAMVRDLSTLLVRGIYR